jgi:hypothetical protein
MQPSPQALVRPASTGFHGGQPAQPQGTRPDRAGGHYPPNAGRERKGPPPPFGCAHNDVTAARSPRDKPRFLRADCHGRANKGAELRTIKNLCRDDPEALDAIDRVTQGKQGARTDIVDNVHEVERPAGNSRDAALRRLRKDRPDLHAQVLSGERKAGPAEASHFRVALGGLGRPAGVTSGRDRRRPRKEETLTERPRGPQKISRDCCPTTDTAAQKKARGTHSAPGPIPTGFSEPFPR